MSGIDATLISQCIKRNERALNQLYRHCFSMMKGICMRYVFDKNNVDEVINNGFLKIVNGLEKYDQGQPFMPWASTVMLRVALDYVRKTMRSTDRTTDLHEDMGQLNEMPVTYNCADLRLDAEDLLGMLDLLPKQTKVVFNLFAIDGYSHKEITNQLNISVGTSKWHVSKARELLKEKIKDKLNKNKSHYEPSH